MASVKYSYRCRIFLFLVSLFFFKSLFQFLSNEFILTISNSQEKPKLSKLDNGQFQQFFNSTCSLAADRRGPHQKIISYSLFGNISKTDIAQTYLYPLINTIRLIPIIYPGWIVRIYHNFTSEKDFTQLFYRHVDLCNATDIIQKRNLGNIFAMTWRWLPLLDEMVDELMSRDSDSKIVPREEEAVQEWLESDKIFHVMRDHPAHCLYGFILGGCWGVKIGRARSKILRVAKNMFTIDHLQEYDYDQILLDIFIWPVAKSNVMLHDSYCCKTTEQSRPFPKQRKDRNFVGARVIPNSTLTEVLSDMDECPLECRQANYIISRWNFC